MTLQRVAGATFAWIVLFDLMHVYWALGGRIGFGDQTDPLPKTETTGAWVFTVVVAVLFALGTVLPLAFIQRWGKRIPLRILLFMARAAALLLLFRGVSAFVDDAARNLFGFEGGITGLTYEDLLGTADPSAYTLWSARAIDAYFVLGGLLYGACAWYPRRRSPGDGQDLTGKRTTPAA